jgi:ATP-dependent RNA helicase DDX10/DBP4
MFERKNQKFEHYSKLIDHDEASDDGDDLITLKREDHGLSSDSEGHREDNISKRKLKMSKSKRAMLKSTELGRKLVFDEEGNPHELYEMRDAEEFFKAGPEGVKDAGRKFAEGERGRLRVADVVDKEEAQEKKREKKRKRKEREKAVRQLSAYFNFGTLPSICYRIPQQMMVSLPYSRHCLMTMDMSPLISILYHKKRKMSPHLRNV